LHSIPIDRELKRELEAFGIDIARVCRTALDTELIRARAEQAHADDLVLHQRGYAAGVEWASLRAEPRELDEIRKWFNVRWHQFSLLPMKNSFVNAYCEATRRQYPYRHETFYFVNDAFTRGMIEGACSVKTHHRTD
jgi:hypothetical protein